MHIYKITVEATMAHTGATHTRTIWTEAPNADYAVDEVAAQIKAADAAARSRMGLVSGYRFTAASA